MGFLVLVVGIALAAFAAFLVLLIRLWRKGRMGKLVGVLLGAGVASQIYLAVYPPESFYRAEFERITGVAFPEDGEFLFKDASYPDFHGDYTSCALVKVTQDSFDHLKASLKPGSNSLGQLGSECFEKLQESFPNRTPLIESTAEDPKGEYSYWALVAAQHEVVIHYVSW